MRLTTMLFRERSNVTRKETITFNAPGIYYPPYGKTVFLMQGQGSPGNAPEGGTYAGTNPATGGSYAGKNSPTGGNYAGTNPSNSGIWQKVTSASFNNVSNTSYGSGYSLPANLTNAYPPGPGYITDTYSWLSSAVPGNAYYNPVSPGYAYYNPYYPGEAYYNPSTPGTAGSATTVLGVTLPGGAVSTSAPVVGYVPVSVGFTNAGVPISVPSGGYVKIQNT